MSNRQRLSHDERQYFARLAEVIFSNPFSTGSDRVGELFSGPFARPKDPNEHAYLSLFPVVESWVKALEGRGIRRLDQVVESDQNLLRYALLFTIYHRFISDFDGLIQDQIHWGDEPAPVPFFDRLKGELLMRSFSEEEAVHLLALFYQMRRAYYFIVRSLKGEAECMRRLRHSLWNNVFTADLRTYSVYLWGRMEDFSTLLLGETGTGKGTAAAAIGRSGAIPFDPKTKRFRHSFTATFLGANLSEFPESLIESELFGHRKGAFTGAIEHHKGLFERSNPNGTLFLDEIGEISTSVQVKLLNVLQERHFCPVGSHQSEVFRGRVIAATNRPLSELVAPGGFRPDFFYRLCSDLIEVPPLRTRLQERPQELDELVTLLVERLIGGHQLVPRVLDLLRQGLSPDYPWPGNVRELEQAVRRCLLTGQFRAGSPLGATGGDGDDRWLGAAANGTLSAEQLMTRYCQMLHIRHGTYEEVARRTGLDRRTVKRYLALGGERGP